MNAGVSRDLNSTGGNMAKKSDRSTRERVYKQIDLVGVSSQGFEAAIESAVRRASDTLKDLRWFEVVEMRGAIQGNSVAEYQVCIRVSFEVH
jgi:flavin-binding protein dodecin